MICDCPSPELTGSRSVLESTQKLICLSESRTYLVCSHVLYLLLHLFGALCQEIYKYCPLVRNSEEEFFIWDVSSDPSTFYLMCNVYLLPCCMIAINNCSCQLLLIKYRIC